MYKINDLDNLLDRAEKLAQEVEKMLKKPDNVYITNLTLALNEYRMAQVQALQGIGQVLEEMSQIESGLEHEEEVLEAEIEAHEIDEDKLH